MVYEKHLIGKTVTIRPATEEDAGFILSVRNDKDLCRYIHDVNISEEEEKCWIRKQRLKADDYFFVIEDKKGNPLGMVGYIGEYGADYGEVCRLVSYGNSIQNIETNLIMTDFAFDVMNAKALKGYMSADNKNIIGVQKKFGYVIPDDKHIQDGMEVVFASLKKEDYISKRDRIIKMIDMASSANN